MKFRNENLYIAMRAYVSAAIRFVFERARQKAPSSELDKNFDFYWTHALYSSDLSEIPEYEACFKELNGDTEINKHLDANVGSYSRGTRTPSADSMMKYVLDLGRRGDQYTFDPERFDREYSFFEETFYSDGLLCEAIAPLQGVLLETPVIALSDGLEISQLQEEEMEPYRTPKSRWDDRWCAIRAKYQVSKIIGDNDKEERFLKIKEEQAIEDRIDERVENVVHALRLFGMGDVYHSGIIHEASKWLFIHSHSVANRVLGTGLFSYQFNEPEAKSFALLWTKLENPKVKKELDTALRRFSYSCVRHHNEDKIIDLMIAAEALFLRGTREGEKSFRLALRAGRFLGRDAAGQKEVYSRMREAYELRSVLVHGERPSSVRRFKKLNIDELIDAVGNDVQAALFKAITLLTDPAVTSLNDEYWNELLFT